MPLAHSYFLTSLFYPLCFSILYFLPYFSVSLLSCYFFSLVFLCSLLVSRCYFSLLVTAVHCAQLRPFYIACCDEFYCFTPQLLLVWCGYSSQTTHWFVGCLVITTILCWLCHVSFPDKRVLFVFLLSVAFPSG